MMKFFLILFVLFLVSCQNQNKEIEYELKICITENLKELKPESTDFYSLMSSLENKMIMKGILEGKHQKDYLKLLNSIEMESKIIRKFYKENINNIYKSFPFNLFIVNDIIFNQCPHKIYSQDKEKNIKIHNIGKLQKEVMENGFQDVEINKKLIKNFKGSDFDKITYRSSIIYIILININLKYNPDYKKLEEYQKNRTFLKS